MSERLHEIRANLSASGNSASAMSKAHAETCARLDFEAVKGQVIRVNYVKAYVGDTDNQEEFTPEGDLFAVVVEACDEDSKNRWTSHEDLDPIWDVRPAPGETRLNGLRSMWVFGRSWRVMDEETQAMDGHRETVVIPTTVIKALAWMVYNEVDQSAERLLDLFHHKPADAQRELLDVIAVTDWLDSIGVDTKDMRGRRLTDDHEACILGWTAPPPPPPIARLRAVFYDAQGVEVDSVEGLPQEVAERAASFMVLHGSDPDENGAAAAPGRVEFSPA